MKTLIARLLIAFVLLFVVTLVTLGAMVHSFLDGEVRPAGEQVILVKPGMSLQRIAVSLEEAGVIGDARWFSLLARWEGSAGEVQAGEYLFREPATPGDILQRLVRGDVRRIQVTFPEGLNLRETAARVAAAGLCSADEFLSLARSRQKIAALEIEADSLEGYLFPETYTLRSDSSAEELLDAMLKESARRLTPELIEAAVQQGLDRHQLVTLASIIQKEAGNDTEMPLISAVFHNRLKRGIALQADPTVIYGIEAFDGNLTRKHLLTPTPYNTYQMRGLPAGPIANPGEDALQAAAHPAEVKYLYFVARGDGTHAFSATLEEHNRAVRRYQLRR